MLDYRFIKENIQAVKENIANRNMNADADLVVELFDKRTALVTQVQALQQKRNDNAKAMKAKLEPDERNRLIDEGKAIKDEIANQLNDPNHDTTKKAKEEIEKKVREEAEPLLKEKQKDIDKLGVKQPRSWVSMQMQ